MQIKINEIDEDADGIHEQVVKYAEEQAKRHMQIANEIKQRRMQKRQKRRVVHTTVTTSQS